MAPEPYDLMVVVVGPGITFPGTIYVWFEFDYSPKRRHTQAPFFSSLVLAKYGPAYTQLAHIMTRTFLLRRLNTYTVRPEMPRCRNQLD